MRIRHETVTIADHIWFGRVNSIAVPPGLNNSRWSPGNEINGSIWEIHEWFQLPTGQKFTPDCSTSMGWSMGQFASPQRCHENFINRKVTRFALTPKSRIKKCMICWMITHFENANESFSWPPKCSHCFFYELCFWIPDIHADHNLYISHRMDKDIVTERTVNWAI
jgi:hypothetical protein